MLFSCSFDLSPSDTQTYAVCAGTHAEAQEKLEVYIRQQYTKQDATTILNQIIKVGGMSLDENGILDIVQSFD